MRESTRIFSPHMHISPSQPLHPRWTKRNTPQVLCVPMVRNEFRSVPSSDKPTKRFKTRNIGEKKQDHLPMIQATHGNSFDSKKKNSRNLQVMPSWIKIPWNKCSLGRRSIKLQIPHGDIPVFCFTNAETVSVGATTRFWLKHCSECFRNKTGCH